MIETLLLAAVMHATAGDNDRGDRPSRGGAVQYGDSGDKAWKGSPEWIRQLGRCIRWHESVNSGHYRAENPDSTASGAYQMLTPMWVGNASHIINIKKYPTAGSAPAWAQDMAFINSINNGGVLHWKGTGCGYGT